MLGNFFNDSSTTLTLKKHRITCIIRKFNSQYTNMVCKSMIFQQERNYLFYQETIRRRVGCLKRKSESPSVLSQDFIVNYKKLPENYLIEIYQKPLALKSFKRHLQLINQPQKLDYRILDIQVRELLGIFIEGGGLDDYLYSTSNVLWDQEHKSCYLHVFSFVGVDLIFLNETISRSQFVEICHFLDVQMFDRRREDRINHKVRMKNFAFLLLNLVTRQLINLFPKLEEIITIEIARQQLKKLPKKFQKYLNSRVIIDRIKQVEVATSINFQQFFNLVFLQGKQFSWVEIMDFLIPSRSKSKEIDQIYKQGKLIYSWESEDLKKFYEIRKLEQPEIFLMVKLNLKVAKILQHGSLNKYLQAKHEFSESSMEIFRKILKLEMEARDCARLKRIEKDKEAGLQIFQGKSEKEQQKQDLFSQSTESKNRLMSLVSNFTHIGFKIDNVQLNFTHEMGSTLLKYSKLK